MNTYFANQNAIPKNESGDEESKQFMLPYSMHYINP